MLRNTVLYRRFWYMKRRNARKINIYIKLIAIIIIFAFAVSYSRNMLYPYIIEYSSGRVKDLIESAVNDAVSEVFEGGIEYSRLVTVAKDDDNILSVRMNAVEAGVLSAQISESINRKLRVLEDEYIAVPLGTLLGSPLFARIGPDLRIKARVCGKPEVKLKSEFTGIDERRTIHRIILEVKTGIGANMPLVMESFDLTTAVPVAERVIIGIMP